MGSRIPGWWIDAALVAVALGGLAAGLALLLAGRNDDAALAWFLATVPVLLALLVEIVTSLRRGQLGLDIVAALSMSAALAFGETLAGNVVALMYAGGQLLEQFAQQRARREMTALLGRVARTAMRHADGGLEEVAIEDLVPRDRILIRHGEVLPVDGRVAGEGALIDASALTGESVPVARPPGAEVSSGTTSVGVPFDLIVSRPARESAYAGIVRLVEAAQRSKAPAVRLADRFAIWFLLFTVLVAGAAWIGSDDPVRALAVLVVATPCPLILAVPVAIISGMSRAAGLGVLVKGGQALEALGRARTVVVDKTGTLTQGRALLARVEAQPGFCPDEVLWLAASLDQASAHVVAAALIDAAHERGLSLADPGGVVEQSGAGLAGRVDGHEVALGGHGYVRARIAAPPPDADPGAADGAARVDVAVDGQLAGILVLEDRVRDDAASVVRRLRQVGLGRIVLATGDRAEVAAQVAKALGLDAVAADLSPSAKVDIVLEERRTQPVMMVGDGVNDAPALAAADIGVAMGARGAAASSESAGIVLLVDRLDRLADAVEVAQRTRRIALQSVIAGLGLSVAAMLVAALGHLPPVQGALLQEVIDVAVILNALRALRG
ncbi:heavy metal translocating P-type ATPase [Geminicoccus roseus]|uniref:heavy metal translocating P-type ATPase n=1 Tax=Geminicoccus roseus TaxID=404900 RepID=UPI0004137C34|nr:heavy metal translocating P-type ATPase [Geminicoccus roseus]